MTPEEEARQKIDALLAAAGWAVQDKKNYNPNAAAGVAIREFPLTTSEADYLLMAGRMPLGVIEAKPSGTTLSGVAEQSGKYLVGLPDYLPTVGDRLPFAYESRVPTLGGGGDGRRHRRQPGARRPPAAEHPQVGI